MLLIIEKKKNKMCGNFDKASLLIIQLQFLQTINY